MSLGAERAANATAFAITYGYPLTQYAYTLGPVLASVGTNAIRHERDVRTAESDHEPVARANADTLSSTVAVDLSLNDVVLTIPKRKDNLYFVVSFFDLYVGRACREGKR
ncbi:hypothetical protein CDD83_4426 [Cordyceps sp. RAO-2017]|nr:hypothetical protein CDD83_4426 [Cordyceps sp. RAO-2017]